MAKTRMLVGDKEAVLAAIIQHKFGPLFLALDKEGNALADEVYNTIYDKAAMAWIAKAAQGALPEDDYINVNAGGYSISLSFGKNRRLFMAHTRRVDIQAGDLVDRIKDRANRLRKLGDERASLRSKTRAAVNSFRTIEDLIAAWPEAEAIIRPVCKTTPNPGSNVPAVLIKDLTAALDLPPDLAEAA